MDYLEKKYLGIDWGEKRIGLALGDDENKIATPFTVVKNIDDIVKIIKIEKINYIVLGEPIKMSGVNNDFTKNFKDFFKIIKNKVNIPVKLVDERLTSKAADALTGTKKTKAARDSLAAMLILQSYFDKEL